MQAIIFDKSGDESVLHVGSAPIPQLGSNDVRIRVEGAGVNRADMMQRQGNYPVPPGNSPILGLEVAGTVMEVGSEVGSKFKAGDQVVVDAGMVLHVPSSWTAYEAAGFMEATLTAYLTIFQIGGAAKGKSVLIHGGGSGVGSQAIALCKAKGITTFVTAGSDEKCNLCAQRGASNVINYKTEDFAEVVNSSTKGKGVDVILDCIGAPYLKKGLECLALDGRIVYIGLMGGAVIDGVDMSQLLWKRVSLIGSTLRSRSTDFKGRLVRSLAEEFNLELKQGVIKPPIDKVYRWESAADAHRRMAASTHFGKILLSMKAV